MEEKEVITTEESTNSYDKQDTVSGKETTKKENEYIDFEVNSGEYKYIFKIPLGSPIGHAYDAAFAVLNRILVLAKEAADKAAPKPVEDSNLSAEAHRAKEEKEDTVPVEDSDKKESSA